MDRFSVAEIIKNVETLLARFFKVNTLKIVSFQLNNVGQAQGFASDVLQLSLNRVEIDQQPVDNLPKTVILKLPDTQKIAKVLSQSLSDCAIMEVFFKFAHKNECQIYEMFLSYNKHCLPLAKFYGCNKTFDQPTNIPMIILEDLSYKAKTLGDFSATLTTDQLLNIIETIANLHIWCWSNESVWQENCADINEIKPFYDILLKPVEQDLNETRSMFPHLFPNDCEISNILTVLNVDSFLSNYSYGVADVLVHGDFHAMNLLFKKEDVNTSSGLMAILDWQLAYKGCFMADFGRLFAFSVDTGIRRQCLEKLLLRYYELVKCHIGIDFSRLKRIFNCHYLKWALLYVTLLPKGLKLLCNSDNKTEASIQREKTIERTLGCLEDAIVIINSNNNN